jgi:hypothetical protein
MSAFGMMAFRAGLADRYTLQRHNSSQPNDNQLHACGAVAAFCPQGRSKDRRIIVGWRGRESRRACFVPGHARRMLEQA